MSAKRMNPILRIALYALLFSGMVCHAALPTQLEPVAEVLKRVSGAEVRAYSTRDFGRENYEGAISVLVPESSSEKVLDLVRKQLPSGLVAFIGTTRSLKNPPAVGVEIVVGPGSYPLDILEIAKTDAVNYGMVTKDLRQKLGEWQSAYGIDIWQAETDTIQIRLKRMPTDIKAFAKEVYKFCPDIVDQGVGSLSALENAIKQQHGVFLWWD